MDIIDVMLAKALTPQGQVDTYAAKARKAAKKAEEAAANAESAIAAVEAAATDITEKQEAADDLLTRAQNVIETVEQIEVNGGLDEEDVDAEIKKLTVNSNLIQGNDANTVQIVTTYPDQTLNTQNITKLYKAEGDNEDGTMTQKAIKTYVNDTKVVLQQAIAAIPSSGGSGGGVSNLGGENAGNIVIIGPDGTIKSGDATEDDIIEALIRAGTYSAKNAVGLEMDYENKSNARTQEAQDLVGGNDFNSYMMYGGRLRCNVSDTGIITAFYGDENYADDGSNGQVMVYQPKFYYQRTPMKTVSNRVGKTIRKDSIMISATAQGGFKIHPIFLDAEGNELDYVLFSAYEGSVNATDAAGIDFNSDKLCSIAGAKPVSGVNNALTLDKAEQLAQNRGAGWHITNMAAESANQMLEIIEYGTMNMQNAIGDGICRISSVGNYNCSSLTGSTANLGNASGSATETINEISGSYNTLNDNGRKAISYRGLENPWGNIWRMVAGVTVSGNGIQNGGIPYICNSFNYSNEALTNDYSSVGFCVPSGTGWLSGMGYGNKEYDWVFIPSEVSDGANSAAPIGDNIWANTNMVGLNMAVAGGSWNFENNDGPFYYGFDHGAHDSTQKSYSARLMFIPTPGTIYNANKTKWANKVGG